MDTHMMIDITQNLKSILSLTESQILIIHILAFLPDLEIILYLLIGLIKECLVGK